MSTAPTKFDTRAEYLARLDTLAEIAHSPRATPEAQQLAWSEHEAEKANATAYGPAFVTWASQGIRYLAFPTRYESWAIIDENGNSYGAWPYVELFKTQRAKKSPSAQPLKHFAEITTHCRGGYR